MKGSLDVWVDKYWRDGNVFIFLMSNKCWQVAFGQPKGFQIYAIDEYDLSWCR